MFPTMFNVLVDAVMRKWLTDVMDNITVAITELQGDDVSGISSLFYANDSTIGSKIHKWLQNITQHLCNLFRDYTGLKPNIKKTKTMTCQPGVIRGRYSMEGYKR